MNEPWASVAGAIVEVPIALQTSEGGISLWIAVLGAFSVLLGAGVALQRRARTAPSETPEDSRVSPPTPPILTDEERVVRLLESNGGRMRQARIVERTDWSKSKVSMLLSEMEDEGALHKLRVGRENIISLPGAEPVAAHPAGEREP